MEVVDCPGCENPLVRARDADALIEAGRASNVRAECVTAGCVHFGRRRTLDGWIALWEGKKDSRPTWDVQFTEIAFVAARRGTCDRSQVGCALVVDNRVITTGYNGSLPHAPHCDEVGHLMRGEGCERTVHAEANAIADAAGRGVSVRGGTAYVTRIPCSDCAKLLIASGIVRVVCAVKYRDPETVRWIFESAPGVRLEWPGGYIAGPSPLP